MRANGERERLAFVQRIFTRGEKFAVRNARTACLSLPTVFALHVRMRRRRTRVQPATRMLAPPVGWQHKQSPQQRAR